jgi:hypothetical protein
MRINLRALHARTRWHAVEMEAVKNENSYVENDADGTLARDGRRQVAKAHFGRLDGEYLVDVRFSEQDILDLVTSWLTFEPRKARIALLKVMANDIETDVEEVPRKDPPLPSGHAARPGTQFPGVRL